MSGETMQDHVLLSAVLGEGSPFRPGGLKTETRRVEDAAEVCAAIDRFGATTGWLEHTGAVMPWRSDSACPEGAFVLAAELARASVSLHVRRVGGGWALTTLTETDREDQLLETTAHITRKGFGQAVEGHQRLTYQVAWEDVGGQLTPTRYRLINAQEDR